MQVPMFIQEAYLLRRHHVTWTMGSTCRITITVNVNNQSTPPLAFGKGRDLVTFWYV